MSVICQHKTEADLPINSDYTFLDDPELDAAAAVMNNRVRINIMFAMMDIVQYNKPFVER